MTEYLGMTGYKEERIRFPADVEERIKNGNQKLYDAQYKKYRYMNVSDERLKLLVEMNHRYRRVYEQEGYIIK